MKEVGGNSPDSVGSVNHLKIIRIYIPRVLGRCLFEEPSSCRGIVLYNNGRAFKHEVVRGLVKRNRQ